MKYNKKIWRVIGCFVLFIVITMIAIGIYLFNIARSLNQKALDVNDIGITSRNEENINDEKDTSITNIALFGVDQRENQTKVHSDAIIIASIDKQNNKIKLASIMRDSLVLIENHGQDKLTQAYFHGGAQLAVKTLNQNFGLNISEYATVNFNQMAQIIDAVGGIDINISDAERLDANKSIQEQSIVANMPADFISKDGYQNLNGTQAVAFARIRHVGNGDFERTDRQREVLTLIVNKALKLNPIGSEKQTV